MGSKVTDALGENFESNIKLFILFGFFSIYGLARGSLLIGRKMESSSESNLVDYKVQGNH